MGIEAVVVAEEAPLVGVVHVDRIGIAMSILTAPSALKVPFSCRTVKFSACVPGPVHGVRIDRMIVRVEHFHVHAREIGRVFAHMRARSGRHRSRRLKSTFAPSFANVGFWPITDIHRTQ